MEHKSIAELAAETKAAFDRPINEIKARLDEAEQKLARRGSYAGETFASSAGQQFIDNEAVKSFLADPTAGRRVGVEVKAIISSLMTDANGSAGAMVNPYRD